MEADDRGFSYCMFRVFIQVSPFFFVRRVVFCTRFCSIDSAWYWVVVDAGVFSGGSYPLLLEDTGFSVCFCFILPLGGFRLIEYIHNFPVFVDNILKVQGLPTWYHGMFYGRVIPSDSIYGFLTGVTATTTKTAVTYQACRVCYYHSW